MAVRVLHVVVIGIDRGFVGGQFGAARRQRCGTAGAGGPVGQVGVEHVDAGAHSVGAAVAQRAVVRHDTGVEDGDAHTRAIEATVDTRRAVAANIAADRAGDGLDRADAALGEAVRRDAEHIAAPRQRLHIAGLHLHRDRMHRRVHGMHRAAQAQHLRAQVLHLGIGIVADDDGLDMAHTVHLARPLRLRCGRHGDFIVQIACDLGAPFVSPGIGMRRRQPEGRKQQRQAGHRDHDQARPQPAFDQDDVGDQQVHEQLQ